MVTLHAYTWGSDQPGAPGAPTGGPYYYLRRRRYLTYLAALLVLVVLG